MNELRGWIVFCNVTHRSYMATVLAACDSRREGGLWCVLCWNKHVVQQRFNWITVVFIWYFYYWMHWHNKHFNCGGFVGRLVLSCASLREGRAALMIVFMTFNSWIKCLVSKLWGKWWIMPQHFTIDKVHMSNTKDDELITIIRKVDPLLSID